MEREPGYYWVIYRKQKTIGRLVNNRGEFYWTLVGSCYKHNNSELEEVGPKIEPPKE